MEEKYVKFYYGVMGSGKTLDLLIAAYNKEKAGKKVVIVKSVTDSKAGNKIQTRFGSVERPVDLVINKDESFVKYFKIWKEKEIDYIYVDEAQFLTKEQIEELVYLSYRYGIEVVCYGLINKFDLELFEGSSALIQMVDFIKLQKSSVCELCGEEAKVNARYKDGKIEISGDSIVIDGTSSYDYKPLCMHCYIKEVSNIPGNMFEDIIRRDSELNNQEDYNNESKPKTLTKK